MHGRTHGHLDGPLAVTGRSSDLTSANLPVRVWNLRNSAISLTLRLTDGCWKGQILCHRLAIDFLGELKMRTVSGVIGVGFLLEARRRGVSFESVLMLGRQGYYGLSPTEVQTTLQRDGFDEIEAVLSSRDGSTAGCLSPARLESGPAVGAAVARLHRRRWETLAGPSATGRLPAGLPPATAPHARLPLPGPNAQCGEPCRGPNWSLAPSLASPRLPSTGESLAPHPPSVPPGMPFAVLRRTGWHILSPLARGLRGGWMILKTWVEVRENGWVEVREKLPPQVVGSS